MMGSTFPAQIVNAIIRASLKACCATGAWEEIIQVEWTMVYLILVTGSDTSPHVHPLRCTSNLKEEWGSFLVSPQVGIFMVSLTKSNSSSNFIQWCSGSTIKTVHSLRGVACAPGNTSSDLEKFKVVYDFCVLRSALSRSCLGGVMQLPPLHYQSKNVYWAVPSLRYNFVPKLPNSITLSLTSLKVLQSFPSEQQALQVHLRSFFCLENGNYFNIWQVKSDYKSVASSLGPNL